MLGLISWNPPIIRTLLILSNGPFCISTAIYSDDGAPFLNLGVNKVILYLVVCHQDAIFLEKQIFQFQATFFTSKMSPGRIQVHEFADSRKNWLQAKKNIISDILTWVLQSSRMSLELKLEIWAILAGMSCFNKKSVIETKIVSFKLIPSTINWPTLPSRQHF